MKTSNKDIGERIFNVIKQLEMTVEKFAETLQTTKFRLYSYKAGKAEAPQDLLEEMEAKYEINSKYIRKGEEPMFLGAEKPKELNKQQLRLFKMETQHERKIPIFMMPVAAGYPTPIDNYIDKYLSVDRMFTEKNFIVEVMGESMVNARIQPGDKLLIDATRPYKDGSIVVASVDGYLTLKRLIKKDGKYVLKAENPDFNDIEVTEDTIILGVMTMRLEDADNF